VSQTTHDDDVPLDDEASVALEDRDQDVPLVDDDVAIDAVRPGPKRIDHVQDITHFVADPEPAPVVAVARLAEILPADFPLPALIQFVPDTRFKIALDVAVEQAMAIDVTAEGGLVEADKALARVRETIKHAEAHFAEPADIAYRLHKSITGTRAEWTKPGSECVATVGTRMAVENRRLDKIAEDIRREQQRIADEAARAEAQRRADAAKAQAAPPQVVEQMQAQAKTATASPVAKQALAPALTHTTITKVWKARLAGTPADDEPNPPMAELTPLQIEEVRKLLQAVLDGKAPLTALDLNWSVLNSRAGSDKTTFAIPGVEAYQHDSTRGKGGRRR
jgi:hypothetical protein